MGQLRREVSFVAVGCVPLQKHQIILLRDLSLFRVGPELGAESLPIGPMDRGSARWVHTRIGNKPVVVTPVTPYSTGRISWGYLSRHFVPGYDGSVPTGRSSPFPVGPEQFFESFVAFCSNNLRVLLCSPDRRRGRGRLRWISDPCSLRATIAEGKERALYRRIRERTGGRPRIERLILAGGCEFLGSRP